ncbi:MAG: hypothetical protein M0Z66_11655 [Thermaerobacter sp.]|nr:hypothetical protein [Thermaerobacter sp.]
MSGIPTTRSVFAIVTLKSPQEVQGGMAPVFYVKNQEEQEHIAMWISRITSVAVHDLQDGTWLLMPI